MSNQLSLIKYEVTGLTPTENRYLSASKAPLIHIMNREAMDTELTSIISKTLSDLGRKLNEEPKKDGIEKALLVQGLKEELLLNFRFMTIEEVRLAFYNGSREAYGEFFGFNVVTFNKWLTAFKTDENRLKTFTKINNSHKLEKKEMTAKEKETIHRNAILKCWEDYKEHKEFKLWNGYDDLTCFDLLKKSEVVVLSRDHTWKIWDQAKEAIKKRLANKKLNAGGDFVRLQDIAKSLQNIDNKDNIEVKNEAKRIALREFFDGLIEMEEELVDRLTDLKFD